MKVLFTTLREKSHFLGMLPFLEAVLRQGHDVAVAAPPDFGERVLATGGRLREGGDPWPARDDRAMAPGARGA